ENSRDKALAANKSQDQRCLEAAFKIANTDIPNIKKKVI
ncbi:MAG: hypothetical protein ACJAU1_001815, partial [Psychromonas sp.]